MIPPPGLMAWPTYWTQGLSTSDQWSILIPEGFTEKRFEANTSFGRTFAGPLSGFCPAWFGTSEPITTVSAVNSNTFTHISVTHTISIPHTCSDSSNVYIISDPFSTSNVLNKYTKVHRLRMHSRDLFAKRALRSKTKPYLARWESKRGVIYSEE